MDVLKNYAMFFGYAIVGAVAMSIALAIVSKTWTWLSPVDEWEELKKGNMAVAVVLSAVIIGFSIVIGFAILPGQ
jgi:uncharacterized membrane protein YjfL (UPF0719 family)